MFEDKKRWKLPTKIGELTYQAIVDHGLASETDMANGVSVLTMCDDCNLPGGGKSNPDTPMPEGERNPCTRCLDERGSCPYIRDVVEEVIHQAGKCNSLGCKRCERKGVVGQLRRGDIVMVTGLKRVDNVTPRGTVVTAMPLRLAGRYLGPDAGGMLRFQLVIPGEGPVDKRFWTTPSGYFLQDPDDSDQEAISGERPAQSKVITSPNVH